jgi:hypothetical protein
MKEGREKRRNEGKKKEVRREGEGPGAKEGRRKEAKDEKTHGERQRGR